MGKGPQIVALNSYGKVTTDWERGTEELDSKSG